MNACGQPGDVPGRTAAYFLVNSSKLGSKSSNIVCALSAVRILITDNDIPPATLQALRDSGIEVVVVGNEDE
ncbi:MAG: hypothetical protein GPOALKHO_000377 [Sodalis sp.]|nr:MAG: hypothetical protein GPOALKHO_000377 [Sodalis sp.]